MAEQATEGVSRQRQMLPGQSGSLVLTRKLNSEPEQNPRQNGNETSHKKAIGQTDATNHPSTHSTLCSRPNETQKSAIMKTTSIICSFLSSLAAVSAHGHHHGHSSHGSGPTHRLLMTPAFQKEDTAVVVIDPQNDFLSPNGVTWGEFLSCRSSVYHIMTRRVPHNTHILLSKRLLANLLRNIIPSSTSRCSFRPPTTRASLSSSLPITTTLTIRNGISKVRYLVVPATDVAP